MSSTLRLSGSKPGDIARAAEILRAGGTVAFPTETVYGLGANALSREAVASIFAAKARPSWDPLIVHVPVCEQALELVEIAGELSRRTEALAAAFWPGPLTLLLPRRPQVPDTVTAGRPLVGLRVPSQTTAQALLRAVGLPLAAPSANRFGHTSPTTAQHVLDDLDGRIDAVLDGGPTGIGVESTVLDPGTTPMTLYRHGPLTPEQLDEVAGAPVLVYRPPAGDVEQAVEHVVGHRALPAPGVGLRHYAPRARLVLVEGGERAFAAALMRASELSSPVGILLPLDWRNPKLAGSYIVESWGRWSEPNQLAAKLFSGLRSLDARGAQVIYCPLPETGGLLDAIRDRLLKAARTA